MKNKCNNDNDIRICSNYELDSLLSIMICRIVFLWVSTVLLWKNSGMEDVFFNSLFMFAVSQIMYTMSIKSKTLIRRIIKGLVLIYSLFLGGLSVCGFNGAVKIQIEDAFPYIFLINKFNRVNLVSVENLIWCTAIVLTIIFILELATWCFQKEEE